MKPELTLPKEVIEAFSKLDTPSISDAMDKLRITGGCLGIHPVVPDTYICGQAFTIPSPIILEVLPNLRQYGNAHWSWFGLQFQPLHDFDRNMIFDATNGVVIAGTEQGSPARKAGITASSWNTPKPA